MTSIVAGRPAATNILCAHVMLLAGLAAGGELSREEAFARAARLDGRAHAVARGLFERMGQEAVPFLRGKAGSADWRERDLARALLLRIEQPEKVTLWNYVLNSGYTLTFRDDGSATVRQTAELVDRLKAKGVDLPPAETVAIARDAVPFLIDVLREDMGHSSSRERVRSRILALLKHFGAAESAPTLVRFYAHSWRNRDEIVGVLASFGEAVLPVLREAIRTCPAGPRGGDADLPFVEQRRRYRARLSSAGAARALGRLGDAAGARLLLERLPEATGEEQAEAFAEALGRMRVPAGVPVVFATLVGKVSDHRESHRTASSAAKYGALRRAMLAFGDVAVGFLRQQLPEGQPLAHRAVATGLLFEMGAPDEAAVAYRAWGEYVLAIRADRWWGGHPDENPDPLTVGREAFWRLGWYGRSEPEVPVPRALRIERAHVFLVLADLRRLARLGGDRLAFDVLAEALLSYAKGREPGRGPGRGPKLALALAATGDERAIEVYRQLLEGEPPHFVAALVEGLLLLGSPKGLPVLDEIAKLATEWDPGWPKHYEATYREAGKLAQAVRPALEGDAERLVPLMASEKPSLRDAAARALARTGDLRALPVLVKAAVAAWGDDHATFREAIVGLGQPAVAPLQDLRNAAADWRERLVCEACALRIARPELAARFEKAARAAHPGYASRAGPDVGTYQGAGRTLAQATGADALPLLEAAVTFGADPGPLPAAAFALAELGQERSIPVLVASFPKMRRLRSGHPVAVALQAFGEKGIEAAKRIPKPDPEKERYESRASRFRGGTEALTIAREVKGVGNILEGLSLPKPPERPGYYAWLSRMKVYLDLARKYHDERLIEPGIRILEGDEAELRPPALDLLGDYDDERVVPLALRFLVPGKGEGTQGERNQQAALRVLTRRLGTGVGPRLLRMLTESKDGGERAAAAWALGEVAAASYSYWAKALKTTEEQKEARAEIARIAVAPLIQALKDGAEAVQTASALALVKATSGHDWTLRDSTPVKPLAAWVRTQEKPPWQVVNYLVKSGDAEAAAALLAVYRATGRWNSSIAAALGKLGCTQALDDIAQAVDKRLADGKVDTAAELGALGNLGEAGLRKVHDVLRTAASLRARVAAASVLAGHRYRQAFPDAQELFEGLLAHGLWDPRLSARGGSERERQLRDSLGALAGSLASLDPQQAYPLLSAVLLRTDDPDFRNALSWQLEQLERARPELRELKVVAGAGALPAPEAGDLAGVPFLEACDLWRRAVRRGRYRVPEGLRERLVGTGDVALDAMVELCYPLAGTPSREQVAGAVRGLADEQTRPGAVKLLALGLYPPPVLDELLADAKGPARRYGLAIRAWRRQGPWFVADREKLVGVAAWLLECHWPFDHLRSFTATHLDRLAKIQDLEGRRTLVPLSVLLASLRYSPDAAQRALLGDYLRKATPQAAGIAAQVMKRGLIGRTSSTPPAHWRTLPDHDYPDEVQRRIYTPGELIRRRAMEAKKKAMREKGK